LIVWGRILNMHASTFGSEHSRLCVGANSFQKGSPNKVQLFRFHFEHLCH
jgi:hypothetical protein